MQDSSSSNVSADALPTVQLDDGVAWAQVMIGNTVYVGGNFSNTRPAGAAKGTNLTARHNVLAYDITTGNLISGFAPDVNGQVRTITKSPDGSRIYIGGDFTSVNGTTVYKVAALNPTTGALISSFIPVIGGTSVNSIAATNSTVYIGGLFTAAGGSARSNLAAYSAAGALLNWTPNADGEVDAMVVTPDSSRVIIGGRFANVNGASHRGLAALDSADGTTQAWAAGDVIKNGLTSGSNAGKAGIYSLSTDGTSIFGTGWVFADVNTGNLEGAFSASPDSGQLNWIEACHGDTYDAYSTGSVVYTVSHAHYCANVGGYPQTDANWSINQRHALAFTTKVTGTLGHDAYAGSTYYDWYGQNAPSMINWFPDFYTGTFTGQGQAAWTVTGNGDYISLGGEFPGVNGGAAYGLTRFALRSHTTPKQGPRLNAGSSTPWTPSVNTNTPGLARVTIPANWDRDNMSLTYKLIRDGDTAHPVATKTVISTFWNTPTVGFNDTTATPGSHTYQVSATDPDGNVSKSVIVSGSVVAGTPSAYVTDVLNSNPTIYWRLGDPSGSATAADSSGSNNGTVNSGVSLGQTGAISGDSDTAGRFDGSNSGYVAASNPVTGPSTFTISSWFKTTTTNGGKIMGFGDKNSGNSSNYDRHVYMDNAGHVIFGVYPGSSQTIQSANTYNDGSWHQVAASLGSNGMVLYIDGKIVAQRSDVTGAQSYNGYWRVGGDSSWTAANYFNGSIDEFAEWDTVVDPTTIKSLYRAGTGSSGNQAPTAVFAAPTVHSLAVGVDGTGSSDSDGTIASYAWNWGDGTTAGTGATNHHVYASAGTYTVTLTVTDDEGATGTATQSVTVAAPQTSSAYAKSVLGSGASLYWRLGDAAGSSSAQDSAGSDNGTVNPGVTLGQPGAIADDSDTSASFSGDGSGLVAATTPVQGTDRFSVAAWFKTTSTSGGKIIGFGDQQTGNSNSYDRHVYMDNSGHVIFGVYPGSTQTVQSAGTYNDGNWHMVVATLSPSGMTLDLDGQLVASNAAVTSAQAYTGVWRVGGDNINGWPSQPSSSYFAGSIDEASVWDWAIDQSTIASLYTTGSQGLPNVAPTAAFSSTKDDLKISVDGSDSTDSDGTIASYDWDWGDNTADGSGKTADHTYASGGTYTVKLTVTDNDGATDTVSHSVTVTAPNQAPTAAFTPSTTGLKVSVDGSDSADSDGTIASYDWDWGDNTADGSGKTATHTYDTAGTYTVKLTVTDDDGATDSVSHSVTVQAPVNQAPTAAFTSSVSDLGVSVDGSGSSDPDGSVASYAWSWGDSTSDGSGKTASHTYASAGTYTVKLTVTDDGGATDSVSHSVTVSAPAAGSVVAKDSFGRTSASGWGSADVGGAWTLTGSASQFTVAGGKGTISLTKAGSGPGAQLKSVSAQDVDMSTDVSLDKVPNGGGLSFYIAARNTSAGSVKAVLAYKSTGAVVLQLVRTVNGADTVLGQSTVSGVTATDTVRVRLSAVGSGPTVLSAKAWVASATEPSAWMVTANDSNSATQGAGSVVVGTYLSGSATNFPVNVSIDSLTATDASGSGA
ncbi:PKD domain-containing protein [Microlunatus endophyticus]|nr:PKD domain-containing protein [Microlunatus endophyticus]